MKVRILPLVIMSVLFWNSGAAQTYSSPETGKVNLTVIMNGGCTFEYELNKDGIGRILVGHSGSYKDSVLAFTDITRTTPFCIKKKKDLKQYKLLVDKIQKSDPIKGPQNWDAWRCVLYIDGKMQLDVYGTMVSRDLYDLIQVVDKSTKDKIDPSACK